MFLRVAFWFEFGFGVVWFCLCFAWICLVFAFWTFPLGLRCFVTHLLSRLLLWFVPDGHSCFDDGFESAL